MAVAKRKAPAKKPGGGKRAAKPAAGKAVPWAALEASPQFEALRRSKAAFIVPAVVLFLAYYLALPLLVGYAPGLMERKAFGAVNWQFVMAWAVAALYVRAAGRHDRQAEAVLALVVKKGGAR
jgi:uncharacterized membrane protein (DUF485 family)